MKKRKVLCLQLHVIQLVVSIEVNGRHYRQNGQADEFIFA